MLYRPPRGINEWLSRLYRHHPLGFPLTLAVVGGALLALGLAARVPVFFVAAALMLAVGLIVLPFGLLTVMKRRLRPVVLRCPHCGAESRNAQHPFNVEDMPNVDYAVVVCSECGNDFTVDKFAVLV